LQDIVSTIIGDVRTKGDEALREYTFRFDDVKITNFKVCMQIIREIRIRRKR